MRLVLLLAPLAALVLIGCRPLDVGAPIEETGAPALADSSGPSQPPIPIRIIDGDTFELGDETIRISNIDAPEMPPRSRCDSEAKLAQEAKAGLGQLMLVDWDVRPTITREGRDRYGRTLARASLLQVDVGEEMVRRGWARPWTGRRSQWCGAAPALATITGH